MFCCQCIIKQHETWNLEQNIMNKYETALAYHHTYHLFGQLFLHGLTSDLYIFLHNMPELVQHLGEAPDYDEAAATHQTLFGFNIHPHESIFLGTDGLLGGEITGRVQETYGEIGYGLADEADHIGRELDALAFLCAAESEAWEDNVVYMAQQAREKQLILLQNHLLRWVWPFTQALKAHSDPFYQTVATLLFDVIVVHAGQLFETLEAPTADFALPEAPAILENEKTSLKDIAQYLVTPAYSGLYLSRDMIGQLGRAFELPRGFGGREQMLTNLMRSAVQFDQLPTLLEKLHAIAQEWRNVYQSVDAPAVMPFTRPWAERVAQTMGMLVEIKGKASEVRDEGY